MPRGTPEQPAGDDVAGTLVYTVFASRPRPDFRLDAFHPAMLVISVVCAVGAGLFTSARIPAMPEQVPLRWDFSGDVTYGPPSSAVFAMVMMLIATLGAAVLSRYPRIYSFPGTLTEHNVQRQYRNAVQMMAWLTASLALCVLSIASSLLGRGPAPMLSLRPGRP